MHHVRPVVVCTTRLCYHGTRSSWVGRKAPQPTALGGGRSICNVEYRRRPTRPWQLVFFAAQGGPCLNRDVTLT